MLGFELPTVRRLRFAGRLDVKSYRDFITEYCACAVCGKLHPEPHHWLWKKRWGNWATCLFCIGLCHEHHREVHAGEARFIDRYRINPILVIYLTLRAWFEHRGWVWPERGFKSQEHLESTVTANLSQGG